eukprot:CAMPEP_0184681608 /NCGR_PEP_ID=MMETSP0312-20130426/4586_1 /TAXON_ID=31354 /ORGANISM="Compsopogon coeruleus, Strain SAG 36.94" /LENGTH=1149 /DNA_ID=CAMNT_0027132563 /DNA_START=409 /DNA_END=3858 /DNA_ORIENTATION=+
MASWTNKVAEGEVKLGPGWMAISKNPLTVQGGDVDRDERSVNEVGGEIKRYSRAEVLALYRPHQPMPRGMHEYPGVSSKHPFPPVSLEPAPYNEQEWLVLQGPRQPRAKTVLSGLGTSSVTGSTAPGIAAKMKSPSDATPINPRPGVAAILGERSNPSSVRNNGSSTSTAREYWPPNVTPSTAPNRQAPLRSRTLTALTMGSTSVESEWQRTTWSRKSTGDSERSRKAAPTPDRDQPLPRNTRDLSSLQNSNGDRSCKKDEDKTMDDKAEKVSDDRTLEGKTQEERNLSFQSNSSAQVWKYRDPQGIVQGPFSSQQLMEWLKAGYYKDDLQVCHVDSTEFQDLGIAFRLRKASPPGFASPSRDSKHDSSNHLVTNNDSSSPEILPDLRVTGTGMEGRSHEAPHEKAALPSSAVSPLSGAEDPLPVSNLPMDPLRASSLPNESQFAEFLMKTQEAELLRPSVLGRTAVMENTLERPPGRADVFALAENSSPVVEGQHFRHQISELPIPFTHRNLTPAMLANVHAAPSPPLSSHAASLMALDPAIAHASLVRRPEAEQRSVRSPPAGLAPLVPFWGESEPSSLGRNEVELHSLDDWNVADGLEPIMFEPEMEGIIEFSEKVSHSQSCEPKTSPLIESHSDALKEQHRLSTTVDASRNILSPLSSEQKECPGDPESTTDENHSWVDAGSASERNSLAKVGDGTRTEERRKVNSNSVEHTTDVSDQNRREFSTVDQPKISKSRSVGPSETSKNEPSVIVEQSSIVKVDEAPIAPWSKTINGDSKARTHRSLKEIQDEEHQLVIAQRRARNSSQSSPETLSSVSTWKGVVVPQAKPLAEIQEREVQEREVQRRESEKRMQSLSTVSGPSSGPNGAGTRTVWNTPASSLPTHSLREQMKIEEERKRRAEADAPSKGQQFHTTSSSWVAKVAGATATSSTPQSVAPIKPGPSSTSQSVKMSNQKKSLVSPTTPEDEMFWDSVTRKGTPSGPPARFAAAPTPKRPDDTHTSNVKQPVAISKVSSNSGITPSAFGIKLSQEFMTWCRGEMRVLTGSQDTTLAEFLVTLQSAEEIRDYILHYLGSSQKTTMFAEEFIRRKEFEFSENHPDPRDKGFSDISLSAKTKKHRRPRGSKVDPSMLGFTSSSTRLGSIEAPDMD